MKMIFNVTGGGGVSGATLTIMAPAGVTVTVSKDGKSRTRQTGSDGIAAFKGLEGGVWTVTITDGTQTASKQVLLTTDYTAQMSFNAIPEFTYTGDYEVVDDADNPITTSQGNWKIRFLTSGTLTFSALNGAENGIDVFCVGAGGTMTDSDPYKGGSGGGYTTTERNIQIVKATEYSIAIGAAAPGDGGATTAFDVVALGGKGATDRYGANGGSGGGASNSKANPYGTGGIDGANGSDGSGKGQGTTTREFGESTGIAYARGGDGGNYSGPILNTVEGYGNGGCGSNYHIGPGLKTGCPGIAIIRNARG